MIRKGMSKRGKRGKPSLNNSHVVKSKKRLSVSIPMFPADILNKSNDELKELFNNSSSAELQSFITFVDSILPVVGMEFESNLTSEQIERFKKIRGTAKNTISVIKFKEENQRDIAESNQVVLEELLRQIDQTGSVDIQEAELAKVLQKIATDQKLSESDLSNTILNILASKRSNVPENTEISFGNPRSAIWNNPENPISKDNESVSFGLIGEDTIEGITIEQSLFPDKDKKGFTQITGVQTEMKDRSLLSTVKHLDGQRDIIVEDLMGDDLPNDEPAHTDVDMINLINEYSTMVKEGVRASDRPSNVLAQMQMNFIPKNFEDYDTEDVKDVSDNLSTPEKIKVVKYLIDQLEKSGKITVEQKKDMMDELNKP